MSAIPVAWSAHLAPGAPGRPARWASGAKSGVGTALSPASCVWFTLSDGIVTEVYYPYVDSACVRDLQFLVTDRHDFFAEEKRDTESHAEYLAPGVPAYRLVNTCTRGRFRVEKLVLADPHRPAILQQVHFEPLGGDLGDFALFALLCPHLGNQGAHNHGWVGDFKGVPMLFAERNGFALALACSGPWGKRSAGYVGATDGWQDISRHKEMRWSYERADDGNVALTGEIDLAATGGKFLLALGFGSDPDQAGHRARAAILQGFAQARQAYVAGWQQWHKGLRPWQGGSADQLDHGRIGAMVMRVHESKYFPGGIIASLAVPWGDAKGDQDMGYHLVWARDMIQTVGGQLAVQQHEDARRVLFYLWVTQNAEGNWPQNMFVSGRHSWNGIQLDETAFVILLVTMARRHQALGEPAYRELWPMVRLAASYLVQRGPVSPMDRWEEEAGYFASTMAVEVPALLVAAQMADDCGEPEAGTFLRETADAWNDAIERLIYVRGTDLARKVGVDGYYVRFARPDQPSAPSPAHGSVRLKNYPEGQGQMAVADIVSPDALALVRFGLRAADDPRMVDTVRVIDATLRVETPAGPCWHRYTADGYGEHADGAPFDGTGIGRAWPLLTGERGHYELAAGHKDEAQRLLHTMEQFAGETGLLPEQIWDTQDLPEHGLYLGRPSGSAMPLVWAHAEYVKLRRSLEDGAVFDTPPQAVERYVRQKTRGRHLLWRPDQPWRAMPVGRVLRVALDHPALVRWSSDGWKLAQDVRTRDTGLGLHVADLPTQNLPPGTTVVFTTQCPHSGQWAGKNFSVQVEEEDRTG